MTARATKASTAAISSAIKAALDNGLTVAEIIIEGRSARVKTLAENPPPDNDPKPKDWPAA